MIKVIMNCLLAVTSIILVIETLEFNLDYLYVLLVIPAVSLIMRRNPFNFPLFAILTCISIVNVLPTQTFYGLVNLLNYLGYNSSYLLDMFHPTRHNIPLIVTMFVISRIVWNSESEITIPLAFAFGFLAYLSYSYLLISLNLDRIVLGLMGVFATIVAFAGVSRWKGC